jgi:hypothetical protein
MPLGLGKITYDNRGMAIHDRSIAGARVLIIEHDDFLTDYLSSSLIEAGASILGPARSIAAANTMLASAFSADAAVVDAEIYEADAFVGRHTIGAAGIPLLLVARGGYKPVFASADVLAAPFAAYQVVDHIRRVFTGHDATQA